MESRRQEFFAGIALGAATTWVLLRYLRPAPQPQLRGTLQPQRPTVSSQRQLSTRPMATTSFMTYITKELWPCLKVAIADSIRASVEPSFASLPRPLDSCRFTQLDLGGVPIALDNVVVHPMSVDHENNQWVQWDFDVVWDGECDISLKADYIGSFGIHSLKLSGRMVVLFKPLTNELPVVSAIQYSFLNPPDLTLRFKGLASVAEISVLETTVNSALQTSLSSMVLPFRSTYRMSSAVSFLDIYQPPVGVARITVKSGRGFVIEKKFIGKDDIPDVYLLINLGKKGTNPPWRTATIRDDCNPAWPDNETADFLISDLNQMLYIHAWDEDSGTLDPDDDLGFATIAIQDVVCAPDGTLELPLSQPAKSSCTKGNEVYENTGAFITLSCQMLAWTTNLASLEPLKPKPRSAALATITMAPTELSRPTITGLLEIAVSRALDLPVETETATTYVKVTHATNEYTTAAVPTANPVYDAAFTIPLTPDSTINDKDAILLELILVGDEDDNNIDAVAKPQPNNKCLGSAQVTVGQLKSQPKHALKEQRRGFGSQLATLEFSISLRGVNSAHTSASGNDVAPSLSAQPADADKEPSDQISVSASEVTAPVSQTTSVAASVNNDKPRIPVPSTVPAGHGYVSTTPRRPSHSRAHSTDFDVGSIESSNSSPNKGRHVRSHSTVSSISAEGVRRLPNEKSWPASIGKLQVTVVGATGMDYQLGLFDFDVPDIYCEISLGSSSATSTWKTSVQHNQVTPKWNESQEMNLRAYSQILCVKAWDKGEQGKEDILIGAAFVTVGEVLIAGGGNVELDLKKDGMDTGVKLTLRCAMMDEEHV